MKLNVVIFILMEKWLNTSLIGMESVKKHALMEIGKEFPNAKLFLESNLLPGVIKKKEDNKMLIVPTIYLL